MSKQSQRLYKRGRIWWGWTMENGKQLPYSTGKRDKKAAEIVQAQRERDAADPTSANARRTTMNEALSLYLNERAELASVGKRSPATVESYQAKAAQIIRVLEHKGDANNPRTPFFLSAVSATVIDGYISQRRQEGISEHTIKKELSVLRGALRFALRRSLWNGNLLAVMPQGFSDGYVPRDRALTWEQVDKLLEALPEKRAAHVAFIVATSASWGESCRAERQDIAADFTTAYIRGTKTAYRKRTVPIVATQQRRLLGFSLEKAPHKEGVLFEPWQNVRRDITDACKEAKIENCTPNDLRRTFATRLHAMGVTLDLLAPPMGHADTRMLERVYGRLPINDLAESMRRAIARGTTTNSLQRNTEVLGKALPSKGLSKLFSGAYCTENPRVGGSTPSLGNPENPFPSNQDTGFLLLCDPLSNSSEHYPENPEKSPDFSECTTDALQLGTLTLELLSYTFLELAELKEMEVSDDVS